MSFYPVTSAVSVVRALAATAQARRDYYRFILRSLEVGLLTGALEKTMGKEYVAGSRGAGLILACVSFRPSV